MMKRVIALGIGILFLGSCGVAPQLTVKSRRYQKGLFVHVGWKQTKPHTVKHENSHEKTISTLPSLETKSTVSQWWTMQKDGIAYLPKTSTKQTQISAENNLYAKDAFENSYKTKETASSSPTFVEKQHRKKLQKEYKKALKNLLKNALLPSPARDQTLSLLSFIFGTGGFLLLFMSYVVPFIGFLSLLAFIAGLILGIIALNKEGGNALAIIGVILSSLGCLLWLVLGLIAGVVALALLV